MPRLLSSRAMTLPCAAISEKLGQPQPESNLSSDLNKISPHAAQRYTPGSLPASRRTWYCSGVRILRHSVSVRWSGNFMVEFVSVELFLAAVLFVGPASQPVTNTSAPKANRIKVRFIFFLPLPPHATRATRASTRQFGTPRGNRNTHTASAGLCDTGQPPPPPKKSARPARAVVPLLGRAGG